MKSRYCSTNVSIYYHFIALVLNVDYVVIKSYIQEIDVLFIITEKLELMEKNELRF